MTTPDGHLKLPRPGFTIGSLFAGIGGMELGLERAGLGPVLWQVEIDSFCRSVLERHWPHATRYSDVREVGDELAPVDVVCGGFPCQPVSVAGRRLAQADERWLWPEFARVVSIIKPRAVIFENVPGLRTAGLRDVLADFAALGFDAEWCCFGASWLGAPHERKRIYCVATHPDRIAIRDEPGWLSRAIGAAFAPIDRCDSKGGDAAYAVREGRRPGRDVCERGADAGSAYQGVAPANYDCKRRLEQAIRVATQRGWARHCGWHFDPVAGVDDGLRGRLGKARKALGNAVVVPCAEVVGRALLEACDAR